MPQWRHGLNRSGRATESASISSRNVTVTLVSKQNKLLQIVLESLASKYEVRFVRESAEEGNVVLEVSVSRKAEGAIEKDALLEEVRSDILVIAAQLEEVASSDAVIVSLRSGKALSVVGKSFSVILLPSLSFRRTNFLSLRSTQNCVGSVDIVSD